MSKAIDSILTASHQFGRHVGKLIGPLFSPFRRTSMGLPPKSGVSSGKRSAAQIDDSEVGDPNMDAIKHLVEAEHDANFRRLANSVPDIVWTARGDGLLDFYNERWYEVTGCKGETVEYVSWLKFMHEGDGRNWVSVWQASVEKGDRCEIECRFLDQRSGQYRWHLCRALPVKDSNGEIVKWFGTCIDIHDHKTAILELEKTKSRLQAVLTCSPFAMQLLSPSGAVIHVNKAWQDLWSVPDEVVEHVFLANYNINNDPLIEKIGLAHCVQLALKGIRVTSPAVCYDPSALGRPGRKRWVEAHFSPVFNSDDELVEVVLMFYDLTERKEAELRNAG